ncbi:hypothetical protein HAX54_047962, partial [Datura stramonium]|nr:hypothetical protein [Datura stramonium]
LTLLLYLCGDPRLSFLRVVLAATTTRGLSHDFWSINVGYHECHPAARDPSLSCGLDCVIPRRKNARLRDLIRLSV